MVRPLADACGLRERLTEERDAVERGRHEEESELHLPAHVHAVAENPADEATDHEAGRPAGMENVQVMRAVVGEERGDQRVGHRFERAVGQGEHERPDIQEHVSGGLRLSLGRGKRDERRQHVEQERRHDQLAVADLVHDHAADDDAEAEAGETGSADGAELRTSEAEVGGPVGKNAAADRRSRCRRREWPGSRPTAVAWRWARCLRRSQVHCS